MQRWWQRATASAVMCGIIASALCLLAQPALSSIDMPDTLVIGKVSHNPKKHYHYLRPIARYAASKLNDLGIDKAKVRMARTKQQLAQWLRDGYVDWVTETAYATAYFMDVAAAEPIAKKWKKGADVYHTVCFARRDSGIGQISDLVGKRIALEDPASTSAFYQPALMIRDAGFALAYLTSVRQKAPAGTVGFIFAGEEITISTMVHKGLVAAGCFNDHDWRKGDHMPGNMRKDLQIFVRGADQVRAIETVRGGLPDKVRERLQTILLNAERDPKAAAALRAYQATTRFEAIEAQDIDALRALRLRGIELERQVGF